MGIQDREELAEGIFAQQGKDINSYDPAQKATYMKGVETRIRTQWELFVENWLNPIQNPLLSIEKAKVDNHDCLFMTQQKAQDPDIIKAFLQQVALFTASQFLEVGGARTEERDGAEVLPDGPNKREWDQRGRCEVRAPGKGIGHAQPIAG